MACDKDSQTTGRDERDVHPRDHAGAAKTALRNAPRRHPKGRRPKASRPEVTLKDWVATTRPSRRTVKAPGTDTSIFCKTPQETNERQCNRAPNPQHMVVGGQKISTEIFPTRNSRDENFPNREFSTGEFHRMRFSMENLAPINCKSPGCRCFPSGLPRQIRLQGRSVSPRQTVHLAGSRRVC
jgi:hypothetical protein